MRPKEGSKAPDTKVVIPCAGRGSRSGVLGPKCLETVGNLPILIRILRTVHSIDANPMLIVSPHGKEAIEQCLTEFGLECDLITQTQSSGMGSAVLLIDQGLSYSGQDILLIWGDQPLVSIRTLNTLLERFSDDNAALSFPTLITDQSYTRVVRDRDNNVVELIETRELGQSSEQGERDIGVFVFNSGIVLPLISSHIAELIGNATGEIGFLGIVKVLSRLGETVMGYPIATKAESMGFNTPQELADLNAILQSV